MFVVSYSHLNSEELSLSVSLKLNRVATEDLVTILEKNVLVVQYDSQSVLSIHYFKSTIAI